MSPRSGRSTVNSSKEGSGIKKGSVINSSKKGSRMKKGSVEGIRFGEVSRVCVAGVVVFGEEVWDGRVVRMCS